MKHLIVMIFILMTAPILLAADSIHYFDLKNRPADEVMPLIRPLLQNNEAMSGDGYQIFIKAPANRVEEIEQLISAVDRASKTFRISVTSDEYVATNENSINASIQIESGDAELNVGKYRRNGPGVTVNVDTRKTENKSDKTQFVQVQEGKPAFVSREKLHIIPIYSYVQRANGDFIIEHDYPSSSQDGFYVLARSADSQSANVSIQSASTNNKSYQGYDQDQTFVDTSLRVPLGKWFEIGGNTESYSSDEKGILYKTKKNSERYNKIFLKVELLP